MYWKDKAVLIAEELAVDDDGYKAAQKTRREVFANKKSATRSEFYTAKQAGVKIALVLEVKGADYQGETRVEHDGRPYEVVRAYTKGGEVVELNCKEAAQPLEEKSGEAAK